NEDTIPVVEETVNPASQNTVVSESVAEKEAGGPEVEHIDVDSSPENIARRRSKRIRQLGGSDLDSPGKKKVCFETAM
ncbi:hypothetical protein, partial [Aeromonas veronii]|uniref:hypothetical protein n=1 Tax=Aeromonas veronii TaxID=654 RepID=UPI00406D32B0